MWRLLIVAAVVISLAWTVAAALIPAWVFWLSALLHLGPVPIFLAALVAYALLGRAKPADFVVREGVGFVVPASRGFGFLVVGEVMLMAYLTDQLTRLWTWGGAEAGVFRVWDAVLSVALLVVYGVVALLVITALRGGPQILLTPAAVVQQDFAGSRAIPWEALRPQQPVQVRGRTLTLIVDRPELVARRGLFRRSTRGPRLVIGHLRVHPWFLADAIWFYIGHPERRDAIGTRAEYERLLPELGVPARG